MDKEQLKHLLETVLNKKIDWVENSMPPTFLVDKYELLNISQQLWSHPKTFFDQLSCITGVDNGPDAGTVNVIYTLYSIPFNISIQLKVILERTNPEIESVSSIWKSADWLEREIFDMYGILFIKHKDLRRILMPGDWEGFPLRKDYEEPKSYRNISTRDEPKSK
jgi:NADH-quinone oxidoreductase subunit C